MAKERMLTVLVPVTDADATAVAQLPAVDSNNINVIYKYNGTYQRVWLNPETGFYEYHEVVDREFPELGKPLEIFDFTYDSIRMGTAPMISASVKWYAEKDSDGKDITLEDKWIDYNQKCHVVFDGINYYLKQIPTSRKDNEDARYTYDMDFVSETVVLETVYIYDVVQPFYTERPVSQSAVFGFYGDVSELVKRVNASLLASGLSSLVRKHVYYPDEVSRIEVPYLTYEQWNQIMVDPLPLIGDVFDQWTDMVRFFEVIYTPLGGNYQAYLYTYIYESENGEYIINGYRCVLGKDKYGNTTSSEEKRVDFDKNYIHDALQQFKDTFDLQYYITRERDGNGNFTGNILIVIGDCEYDFADMNAAGTDYVRDADGVPTTEHPFDYGTDFENNGNDSALLSKEKTNTTEKIVTRITGVGSSDNIPWYYPNPTADGWIKPMFKISGVAQDGIAVDYPVDEGTTVDDSVLYEKYLKNRIGDVFQYGLKKGMLSETSYKESLSGETGGENNVIQLVYVIDVKTGYTTPKFKFELAFLNESGMDRLVATLRDNTASGTTVGTYDSDQTYVSPTDFQQAFISADGSVSLQLTAGHIYYLFLNIYIDGTMPLSQKYDGVGYHYPGRDVGYTNQYNQYYPNLSPVWRYVHIREDFYAEDGLEEVGDLFAVYYTNQHNIVIGYSADGTPATSATPMPRLQNKKYKDKNTGVIYECTGPASTTTFGYTANPVMDFVEWVKAYMRFSLSVWSVDGWYKKSKRVVLADYGLTLGNTGLHTLDITDTIEFKRLKYITPCSNLMPEVYVKTDGERRCYDAINYPRTGTPDPMIGETTGVGGVVVNPIYQKNGGTHYDFENEIMPSQPKEYIEDFDDIKPSIKGQYNYYRVVFDSEPSNWADIYTEYYTKTLDGEYIQATSTWSSIATYYRKVRIDVAEEFAYDVLDSDEIWESNDDGNVAGEYKHPYFFVKLRPLGFNIFDLALQDDMVISMTTGNCGACNFKIGVDENTGKNPVQIWEYDVYGGYDYEHKGQKLYSAGDLRRYVDTSQLYYDTDGTSSGYIPVDRNRISAADGFLVSGGVDLNTMFERNVYSAEEVISGAVGTMRLEPKTHFEGDVMVSGKFIESQQNTADNFVWVALFKDTDSYGTIMPSAKPDYDDGNFSVYIRPKSVSDVHTSGSTLDEDEENADKFVIINIRMPQRYFRYAERELSKKLVEAMDKNNYQKFNFSQSHSRIFLAQRKDVDDNLNENSVVYICFNRKVYRQYVQHYTYKMSHDAVLPEISLDMNEELSVSRTKRQRDEAERRQRDFDMTRSFTDTTRKLGDRITKRTVSRNDDVLISGNFVSRDGRASVFSLSADMLSQQKTTTSLEVSRESTKEYIMAANTFNGGVDERLKQIRMTIEKRLLPVSYQVETPRVQESCKDEAKYSYEPESTAEPGIRALMWLDSTGKEQTFNTDVSACPSDQGMTDITWSVFNFS